MTVNSYFNAKPFLYASTYVPINFQTLFTLGNIYKKDVEQTTKDITDTISKFGDFASISDVDTKRYYDESLGKLNDLINKFSTDPNSIKDPLFRSEFYSRLNNLDYALLSKIKKSAENAAIRQQNVETLQSQNKYASWFDDPRYVNLATWDTASQGVMSDLAPEQYVSLKQLGDSYTAALKPNFYKGKAPNSGAQLPFTNWLAISRKDIHDAISGGMNDILSSSAGQKQFQRFSAMYLQQNPDASQAELVSRFTDLLASEQSDKLVEKPETDTAGLSLYKMRMEAINAENLARMRYGNQSSTTTRTTTRSTTRSGSGGSRSVGIPNNVMSNLEIDQRAAVDSNTKRLRATNPAISRQFDQLDKEYGQFVESVYNDLFQEGLTTDAYKKLEPISRSLLSDKSKSSTDKLYSVIELLASTNPKELGIDQVDYEKIRYAYDKIYNKTLEVANEQNQYVTNELVNENLRLSLGIAEPDPNKKPDAPGNKEYYNPLIPLFQNVTSAGLRGIDDAITSIMGDVDITTPEEETLKSLLFKQSDAENNAGYKPYILDQFDDAKHAYSSFDFLYNYYPKFKENADNAAWEAGYNKTDSSGIMKLYPDEVDAGWMNWGDDMYSIRNAAANMEYPNMEVYKIKGFMPMQGMTDQNNTYAFNVLVRVPTEDIDKHYGASWQDLDSNNIKQQTGLDSKVDHIYLKKTDDGEPVYEDKEWTYIPMVIERTLTERQVKEMNRLMDKNLSVSSSQQQANEQEDALRRYAQEHGHNTNDSWEAYDENSTE